MKPVAPIPNVSNDHAPPTQATSSIYKPFRTTRTLTRDGWKLKSPSEIKSVDKPQNLPKPSEKRGEGAVKGTKRKNKYVSMTNYEPAQIISLGDRVLSVHMVTHDLGREILGVRFATRVEIHALRLRTVDNEEFFTMEKIQECSVKENDLIQTLVVGENSNIGIGTKMLVYAFSIFNRSTVFYVKDKPKQYFSFCPEIYYEDDTYVQCLDDLRTPVRYLAFDGEEGRLLAALAKEPICKIWDVQYMKLIGTIHLESPGVAVVFHKSDTIKFIIAERDGLIKFYSLTTMRAIYSIHADKAPILCIDWSLLNYLSIAIGHINSVHMCNTSELNAMPLLSVDSFGLNKMVKFSTEDRFIFATVSKPKNYLRVYHNNLKTPLWTCQKEQIQCIEWVYGRPFLMACVGETIQFFEASLY